MDTYSLTEQVFGYRLMDIDGTIQQYIYLFIFLPFLLQASGHQLNINQSCNICMYSSVASIVIWSGCQQNAAILNAAHFILLFMVIYSALAFKSNVGIFHSE